ncbi:hypothetical protein ONZ51_g6294 [Trametes cubensis]|uniref:Uncharacterized protein n=1 Tax=Trametes cubensis TaxID=1111947 RepID=A0AAD7TSF1_9APHY|nr:hypothetical protein ONZ51_g6294 [Trametes cubensis]
MTTSPSSLPPLPLSESSSSSPSHPPSSALASLPSPNTKQPTASLSPSTPSYGHPPVPMPPASLEEHLEQLTDVVQETGHLIHVCSATCAARCALAEKRDAEERARTASVQEQLARMLAMTQEMVRREKEERVTSSPQKYVQDLQRAAFGAGGHARLDFAVVDDGDSPSAAPTYTIAPRIKDMSKS